VGQARLIRMRQFLRTIVKRPLHLLGLDLVRYNPRYALGEYAYVASLNIKTVIDVGAHTGEFARMIKTILPEAAIFSFEPLHAEFESLRRQMENGAGFIAFNCAVGDRNETVEIQRSSYAQSSSILSMAQLHKDAFPASAGHTVELVEVKRLDDVLRDFELKREILIKIDVQGYEDKVIGGAEQTIDKAKAIIIEVSFRELYEGQPLFENIFQSLSGKGFKYFGNLYQLLSPIDGAPLQADALFVRA
jgi:FkbM family methyltransferase